jgi:hypothetical protein
MKHYVPTPVHQGVSTTASRKVGVLPYRFIRELRGLISAESGDAMQRTIGIILIVLGIAAFVFQGFSYTTEEKVLDVGPLEVTKEERKTIPLPPVLGALALLGGVGLVALGGRKG